MANSVATLKLERIGEAEYQYCKLWSRVISDNLGSEIGDSFKPVRKMPWVAEIVGVHPRFKFRRKFLKPTIDRSQANSIGSRGVYAYYFLEPGKIYDVSCMESWRSARRYFARVVDGEIEEIDEDEVIAWLNGER